MSAWLRSCVTWLSTPPDGEPAAPSPGAPAADAEASASEADAPSAWKETVVPAVTSRCVVDSTVCVASVSPSATPIAAVAPTAEPEAEVVADALSSAFASSLPVSVSSVPAPIVAAEETFEIATAIDGTTVTPPPAAPVCACVVIACVPLACSVRSWPPVSTAVSSSPAKVVSLTIESANETPRPKSVPPVAPPGSALTVLAELETASRLTSPAATVPPERIAAVVLTLTMLIETEPATPTEPPPAPEVDCAPNWFVASPETFVIPALAPNDAAVTTPPPSTTASFVTFARLIATPAPTLIPEPTVEAEPSADAFASEFTDEPSVAAPVAVTCTPAGT